MLELIAIGAGVALVAPAVNDWCLDGRITGRTLTVLVRATGLRVTSTKPIDGAPTARLDDWLAEHAGTTDVSDADREFFAEQLRLAAAENS